MEAVSLIKTAESYLDSMKKELRRQYGGPQAEPQGANIISTGEAVALTIYSGISVFCGFLFAAALSYIFITGFFPVHELANNTSVPLWKRGLVGTGMVGVNIFFPTLWSFIRLMLGGGVLPYAPMTKLKV